MKTKIFKIFGLLLCLLLNLTAQTDTLRLTFREKLLPYGITAKVPENYPVVSLALSGGGARAIAQVGILKALKERDVFFENIAGTSMGSIIGGLYSVGYTIPELENIARTYNWAELIYKDKINRNTLFVEDKLTADKAFIELQLEGFRPVLPSSWSSGKKVSAALNTLIFNAPLFPDSLFGQLFYDFSAVCTDLENGREIVVKNGSMSKAMRASSSFSLLLPPVKFNDYLLADGGLVANVPVKIAKDDGAEVVIAVNSTSPLHSKQDLKYPWNIADQAVSIPMAIINEQNLEEAEIVLEPAIGDKSSTDFTGIDDILISGYIETIKKMADIKEVIKDRIYAGCKGENNEYLLIDVNRGPDSYESDLLNRFRLKNSISSKDINYEMIQLFNKGDYKDIFTKIEKDDGIWHIKIIPVPNKNIQNIVYKGINKKSPDDFKEPEKLIIEKPYNPYKTMEFGIMLTGLYRNEGNSMATVENISFNETNGVLTVNINEGIIDSIAIIGNLITNRTVISREIPFSDGDIFERKTAEKALLNLHSTNLFEDVEFKYIRKKGKNILCLELTEKRSQIARFGLRIDNEYGTQVSADLRDENLFGTGTEIGLIFNSGLKNRMIALEHKSNRIFDTYLTYKLQGYHGFNDIKVYAGDSTKKEQKLFRKEVGKYRHTFTGALFALGSQVERFGNVILQLKYENTQVINLENFGNFTENNDYLGARLAITIDSKNDYPYPTSGFLVNGFYESALQFEEGKSGFTKLFLGYESYFSVSDVHTFCSKLTAGYADNTTSLTQQFSFGGQSSFFGYREHEFMGRQLFIASLEYRYKLPIKIIVDSYLKFRYDLGSIWEDKEKIKLNELRHAIGFSVSFNTPIGPADFSIGRSFLINKGLKSEGMSFGPVTFYFTIGYNY